MTFRSLFVDAFVPPISSQPEYWFETRRPFCNLVFLLPLLLAYEVGVYVIGSSSGDSARNGADAWMRLGLQRLGVDLLWLLPALLVGALLSWQWASRQPWRMSWDTLGGMLAESLLFAFVLILIGQLTDFCFRQAAPPSLQLSMAGCAHSFSIGGHSPPYLLQVGETAWNAGFLVKLIAFMGAGIYEEFLFRLCLIPVTYAAFRAMFLPHRWSVGGTIVLTSLVFSLAHYLGPAADGQSLSLLTEAVARVQSSRSLCFSFVFRTLAGMFFASLFFLRGFGITVGTHAVYDVFVGIVLVSEV